MLIVSNSQCRSSGLQQKVLACLQGQVLALAYMAKSLALKTKSLALVLALKAWSLLTSLLDHWLYLCELRRIVSIPLTVMYHEGYLFSHVVCLHYAVCYRITE